MPSRATPLCLCGCGVQVNSGRFVHGHAASMAARLRREAQAGSLTASRRLYALGWQETTSKRTPPNAFGLELEVIGLDRDKFIRHAQDVGLDADDDGYHHQAKPYWRLTDDSSLYGPGSTEIVSPILPTNKTTERDIQTVCKIARDSGAYLNTSAGLHVHHNARKYSQYDLAVAVQGYATWQPIINEMVTPNRTGNSMCEQMDPARARVWWPYGHIGNRSNVSWAQALQALSRQQLLNGGRFERYVGVNLCALGAHGTVEFRQHQATLQPERIIAWRDFTKSIMEASKNGVTLEGLTEVSKDISAISRTARRSPSTISFMLNFFTAPPSTEFFASNELRNGDWNESQADSEDYRCRECGDRLDEDYDNLDEELCRYCDEDGGGDYY